MNVVKSVPIDPVLLLKALDENLFVLKIVDKKSGLG